MRDLRSSLPIRLSSPISLSLRLKPRKASQSPRSKSEKEKASEKAKAKAKSDKEKAKGSRKKTAQVADDVRVVPTAERSRPAPNPFPPPTRMAPNAPASGDIAGDIMKALKSKYPNSTVAKVVAGGGQISVFFNGQPNQKGVDEVADVAGRMNRQGKGSCRRIGSFCQLLLNLLLRQKLLRQTNYQANWDCKELQ